MASNAANEIFTNSASPSTEWSRVVLFFVIFMCLSALAYFVYINFIVQTTTLSYPFHQHIWNKWVNWYKPELLQPEHDKKVNEDVISDHTKLTGEPIEPPSSQPTATPSVADEIAEAIVHNGEPNKQQHKQHKQESKHPRNERENWCFVGEDLSGRYCVRVPSDKQCTSERLFHSRVDCEMAAANHLPAGVLTHNGDKYVPLATKNIV